MLLILAVSFVRYGKSENIGYFGWISDVNLDLNYTEKCEKKLKKCPDGAAVSFLVFNEKMNVNANMIIFCILRSRFNFPVTIIPRNSCC